MTPSNSPLRLGFIGGGNMASALIGGLAGKLTDAANIQVVEIDAAARARLEASSVRATDRIDATLAQADVLILAVKPQQMREVAAALKPFLQAQLVVSIAAGIRMQDLSRWLGGHPAIVRCMPNTPALIGQGITGMVAMAGVSAAQRAQADAILCAVGSTVWLDDEALIDPVTAMSGSGPAYVFYFIEAMQAAGVQLGLTEEQATALAIATFKGAAQLAANASEPVAVLRERVTSKGGTTHAGLTSLQESGVADAIVKAIGAASARGKALGEEFGKD